MSKPPLRSWMLAECLKQLKTMDCPTDPVSVRSRLCPECGRVCQMTYGVHGKKWFLSHPVLAGGRGCKHEMRTWRGDTKEEADREFNLTFGL